MNARFEEKLIVAERTSEDEDCTAYIQCLVEDFPVDPAEQASLAAMFETRKGMEDWKTGTELKEAALSYLHEHRDALFEAVGID